MNRALLAALDRADLLLVAGEASNHCVRATTEHVVDNLPGGRPGRVVCSPTARWPRGRLRQPARRAFLAGMRAGA